MSTMTAPVARTSLEAPVTRRSTVVTGRALRCGHAPSARITLRRSGIRLTQRGRIVVVLGLVVVMTLLVIAGALRATAAPAGPPAGWGTTVVQPGDTLWSLAHARVRGGDPRALIVEIKAVNGLADSQLASGQRLLLPH